jgi:hypothetical protein
LTGLADDEGVVEESIGDGAGDGDERDEERPTEAEAAEGEAFVEVVGSGLYRFEDFGVSFGKARWEGSLLRCHEVFKDDEERWTDGRRDGTFDRFFLPLGSIVV